MKRICLIISLILVLIFSSCKELKEISVIDVDGFSLTKMDMKGLEGEINLKIKNPNDIGFSIYPSEFDIIYSGIHLGKAKLNKRVHINKMSERVYSFEIKSKLEDLNPLDLFQLLNQKNLNKIEIKGNLKAGKFYLKKKFNVNYTDNVKILQ